MIWIRRIYNFKTGKIFLDFSLDVENGMLFWEGVIFTTFILKIAVPLPDSECTTVVPVQAPHPAGLQVARCGDTTEIVVLVTVLSIKCSKVCIWKKNLDSSRDLSYVIFPNDWCNILMCFQNPAPAQCRDTRKPSFKYVRKY